MGDIDVDALLARAEAWVAGDGRGVAAWKMIQDLVAALRAVRERATARDDDARALLRMADHETRDLRRGVEAREDERNMERKRAHDAMGHLRAILDWMWPEGTTGPACVREARAFLAGEAQPVATDWRAEFEKASAHLGAMSAMLALYGLPSDPKALAAVIERERVASKMRAQSDSDEVTELRRRIDDMQVEVRNIGRDLDASRAKLAAEREAHAETKRMWELGAANEARLQNELEDRKAMQTAGERLGNEALAEECAAHEATRRELAFLAERAREAARSHLDDRRILQGEAINLRAELATEQEQHMHTRATLADAMARIKALEDGIAALAATMKAGRA